MSRPRVLSAATLAALVLAVTPAATGAPNSDVHYFRATIVGTGSANADYGNDGKDPSITTGSGVDGQESAVWRWEVQAVGTAVGNGPLTGTAEIYRERKKLRASIVSWSVQMSNYDEKKLCKSIQGTTTFVSEDFEGRHPRKSGPGEFFKLGGTTPGFSVDHGRLLTKAGIGFAETFTCYHGPSGHGLLFFQEARGKQAPIPRGAFNPRSDRHYEQTFTDSAHLGLKHSGDPNQAHVFEGKTFLKVEIDEISERRFDKLERKYDRTPQGCGACATSYSD